MKLKYTGIIEVEDSPLYVGSLLVTKGTKLVPAGQVFTIEEAIANFTPADNDSLNLLDPDRVKRLCPPIIG